MSENNSSESNTLQPRVTQVNTIQSPQKAKQEYIRVRKNFHNYYIEYKLQDSGIANLYRAIDQQTTTPVLIREFDATDNEFRDYLSWEYNFLSHINHPNIVKARELIDCGDKIAIVFEFAEGLSLKEILAEERKFSWPDRIAIAYNIANGVNVLNKAGIILRDMKPANIMINQQMNQIKILYHGLENPSNKKNLRITLRNKVDESVMYLSPEQTEGRQSDRSNVFSLGTICYQLFANNKKSPFYSDNPFSCCYMVGSHNPLILEKVINSRDIDKDLRKYISNVIKRAMEKNDKERWVSAEEMAMQLARCYFAVINNDNTLLQKPLGFQPQIDLSGKEVQLQEKEEITSLVLDIDNIDIEIPADDIPINEETPPKKNKKLTNRIQYELPNLQKATQGRKMTLSALVILNVVISCWLILAAPKQNTNEGVTEKPQYTTAKKLFVQKRYLETMRVLQKIMQKEKNNAQLHRDLAACYKIFGEYTKAIHHYEKMLEITPNAEIYYALGNCYAYLLSYNEAISCFKKALKIQPTFTLAAVGMADIFYATRQHTKAIYYYKQALKQATTIDEKAKIHFHIALSFFRQKNYATAVDHYSTAIELKPQEARFYNKRAAAYKQLGKEQLAAKDLATFHSLQIK
ncbi:protein kinase family protein [Candidatus Uabimicrobium amorphum]|uniref:Protein kinase n=1 Tax=Uabimicrobium amorphum TaxID=2596890 RepID=A0A5S9F7U7_UABAM|nr:protein kinase family protein [Candidatus Uabimicrobium amorphum]BBM88119.1 protein kinase [Candidatus Uabimicrobium amorphum]